MIMTQYDVKYQVGSEVKNRSLTLFEPSEEDARQELLKKGLVKEEDSLIILEIVERFGMC